MVIHSILVTNSKSISVHIFNEKQPPFKDRLMEATEVWPRFIGPQWLQIGIGITIIDGLVC